MSDDGDADATPGRCSVCGDPENEHFRIHPYTPAGAKLPPDFFKHGQKEKDGVKLPFDPVLRQALLDKGIIAPEDLRAASDKVHAIMSGGVGDGEPRPEKG